MQGFTRAALATTAALALTAFGITPALASGTPEPKPGPWQTMSETTVFPKGTACKAKVVEKAEYKFRVTELKPGVIKYEFKNWSYSTFTNPKKHKSYTIGTGGDFLLKYSKDGERMTLYGQGENYGQGKGVKGIVYSKGKITIKIVHPNDPVKTRVVSSDLTEAKKVIQVCYKVGTKPVWGENIV